jgi:hypothetical protein
MADAKTYPPPSDGPSDGLPSYSQAPRASISVAPPFEILTVDGKIETTQSYEVSHLSLTRATYRQVVLKDQSIGEQVFIATLDVPDFQRDIRSITLRHQNIGGVVEGKATVIPAGELLGTLDLSGLKTKIIEKRTNAKDDTGLTFQVGELFWRPSKRYLHAGKGKSKAGDLELVDRSGKVLAVFMNCWTGDPEALSLGRLCLTAQTESTLPLVLLSALLVVLRLSWRAKVSFVAFKDQGKSTEL